MQSWQIETVKDTDLPFYIRGVDGYSCPRNTKLCILKNRKGSGLKTFGEALVVSEGGGLWLTLLLTALEL